MIERSESRVECNAISLLTTASQARQRSTTDPFGISPTDLVWTKSGGFLGARLAQFRHEFLTLLSERMLRSQNLACTLGCPLGKICCFLSLILGP